jgi:hypothetical protein
MQCVGAVTQPLGTGTREQGEETQKDDVRMYYFKLNSCRTMEC